jgi:hypothetical protein
LAQPRDMAQMPIKQSIQSSPALRCFRPVEQLPNSFIHPVLQSMHASFGFLENRLPW